MAKPIKPTTEQQALIFDLWWRMRDAIEAGDLREVDKLRIELRSLFDLNDKGLDAGRTLYHNRLADAGIPENFRDLPKAQRRRLIKESYQKALNAKADDTSQPTQPKQPAPRPEPTSDDYMKWFESLTNAERDVELDAQLDRMEAAVAAYKKAQSPAEQPEAAQPVDDPNELVDADELAQLRQMWGDA